MLTLFISGQTERSRRAIQGAQTLSTRLGTKLTIVDLHADSVKPESVDLLITPALIFNGQSLVGDLSDPEQLYDKLNVASERPA